MDPILTGLLEAVNRGGAAVGAIMTILWWLERGERKEMQSAHIAAIPAMLAAINDSKTAVAALTQVLLGREPPRRTE